MSSGQSSTFRSVSRMTRTMASRMGAWSCCFMASLCACRSASKGRFLRGIVQYGVYRNRVRQHRNLPSFRSFAWRNSAAFMSSHRSHAKAPSGANPMMGHVKLWKSLMFHRRNFSRQISRSPENNFRFRNMLFDQRQDSRRVRDVANIHDLP